MKFYTTHKDHLGFKVICKKLEIRWSWWNWNDYYYYKEKGGFEFLFSCLYVHYEDYSKI